MQPIFFADVETLSFRQIDELNGFVKGASFKLFKMHRAALTEGIHYFYLSEHTHRLLLADLKKTERIYASSLHLVLLTRQGYRQLQQLSQLA